MASLGFQLAANPRICSQMHYGLCYGVQHSDESPGPVVQSIVSLMSLLVVKMLTVLVSTISNSQVFLLKKNVSSISHFFSKNISIFAIFYDQSFNDSLTNDIVSFEQVGPCIF